MEYRWIYFSMRGRLSPGKFWRTYLGLFVVGLLANLAPVVGTLVGLGCTYATLCVCTKRLHDMGRSGWLQALAMIPWVATLAWAVVAAGDRMGDADALGRAMVEHHGVLLAAAASLAISIAFLVWLARTPGDAGPNPYGERADDFVG